MSLQQWALPQLSALLPLDEEELKQILTYTNTLPDQEAAKHLQNMLGDSPPAVHFISSFIQRRGDSKQPANGNGNGNNTTTDYAPPSYPPPSHSIDSKQARDIKNGNDSMFHPGSGSADLQQSNPNSSAQPPVYAPPSNPPPAKGASIVAHRQYTNAVIEAAKIRAQDEVRC